VSRAPKNPSDSTPAADAAKTPPVEDEKPVKADKGDKEKGGKEKGGKGKDGGKGKAGTAGAAPSSKKRTRVAPDNPNFRYIVRMAGSDLDGLRPAGIALTGVRGVGRRIAEMALRMAAVNPSEMIGNIPEPTVEGIEQLLADLPNRTPAWVLNHRVDHMTGETHHLFGPDIETGRRDDVNIMKMIRSYRGVRHERGQKVRGQRTRSNGRTGMAAGVMKKAAKEAAAAKGKESGSPGAPAAPAAATPAATPAAPAKKV
jgi:small subunit ribosomal protein S13